MRDIERIELVTRNYVQMQGLKIVPLGLYFLAVASGILGEPGDCTFMLPVLIGVIILYRLIELNYRRRFGWVKQLHANPIRDFLLSFLVFGLWWGAAYLDFTLELPVSLVGLVMASILVVIFARPSQRFRAHYLVMAGLIAIISLMPLAGISSGGEIIQPTGPIFNVIVGLILILGGIIDHFLLLNLLRPIEEESHGRSI
jgi:hypothetical protein